MLLWCFQGASEISKDVTRDLYMCLKDVLKGDLSMLAVYQDCLTILQAFFKDVTACFNGFLRVFQNCLNVALKNISRMGSGHIDNIGHIAIIYICILSIIMYDMLHT